MSFLGKIFGSDNAVTKSIDLIDNAFYTDEEKAEQKKELLKAYEPFKLAQRYLALIYSSLFAFSFIAVFIMTMLNIDISKELGIIKEFNIGIICLTILGFYFGGGTLNSLVNLKK